MLDLAARHLSELNDKFHEIWYDPKYQYFFGQRARFEIEKIDVLDRSELILNRAFCSFNSDQEMIGYIAYQVDTSIGLGQGFEILRFSSDKGDCTTFGIDMYKVFRDCFEVLKLNTVAWNVFIGNPVEVSYDHLCERMGGRIVGIQKNRGLSLDGRLLDKKLYEITREDYIKARKKGEG